MISATTRLIVSDLDGTLLRHDKTVSHRTRAALAAANEHGIVTAIATARPPATARAFADAAGVGGLAICVNGALLVDLDSGDVLETFLLDAGTAADVVSAMRAALPGVCFACLYADGFGAEPAYRDIARVEDHGRLLETMTVDAPEALVRQPAVKLIVRHPIETPRRIVELLRALPFSGFETAFSGAPFVEVVAAGVTKGAGLAGLVARLGIDRRDVVAFGDAPNDAEMLAWAGHAVAVANAYPEILAIADEIAPSNEEDGVAVVIERLLARTDRCAGGAILPGRKPPDGRRDSTLEAPLMTATFPATRADHPLVAPDQVLDTPCMVVDERIMSVNIAEMQSLAASFGVALRPHIKTHKTPQIAMLQLAAGAIGITCAKLGEAEAMVDGGVTDVLIAYPFYGATKIARLLPLMERARIIASVDSLEAAEWLSGQMTAAERSLELYLEVDTGQNRSGVPVGEAAVNVAVGIARMRGVRLIGIFSHEGHANTQPPETIESVAVDAGEALVATAAAIRAHGIDLPVVSVGSTPAASYTPAVAGVTEMRPGTYVFKDTMAFRYGIFGPDRCAARMLATVVSHAAADRCILDCGSKALALDGSKGHPGHGYIVGHATSTIHALSEEHGWVTIGPDDPGFALGDRVEVIPNHICPSVNLMDELIIVRDGHAIDRWPITARGRIR